MKYVMLFILCFIGCQKPRNVINDTVVIEDLTIVSLYGHAEKCIIGSKDGKRISYYDRYGNSNIEKLWETAKIGDTVEIRITEY